MAGAADAPSGAQLQRAEGSGQAPARQRGAGSKKGDAPPVKRKALTVGDKKARQRKAPAALDHNSALSLLGRTQAYAAEAEPEQMAALVPLRPRQAPATREHEREPASKAVAAGLHVLSGGEAEQVAAQLQRHAARHDQEKQTREQRALADQRAADAELFQEVREFNQLHLRHHGRPAGALPPSLQGKPVSTAAQGRPVPTAAQSGAQPRRKRSLLSVAAKSKANK
ncbi:hypothetical protein C2E21_1733 [Chlorella sorokiniana]|uniref:Uncharacterized protein n=1 Tax=Chlorella sorokiniana TaxID=3076 RepID=A0A2P6U0T6_CHLSO|nr:hypothetical protein C2E21_1733 [Chlorella sorokiniana]|eukprot:PRW59932.1 hypothetical protein C2E21_1733 [Chlorella sorokiniana]